ncbi:hypothetical protein ACFZAU_01545 [Streptomyces sp. NPDC008238]
MDIHVEATLDSRATLPPGAAEMQWFDKALSGPLAPLVRAEEHGEAITRSLIEQSNSGKEIKFAHLGKNRSRLDEELAKRPEWAVTEFYGDDVLGRVRARRILPSESFSQFSIALQANHEQRADVAFCAALVEFLATALDEVNPVFARIEYGIFDDETNLDIALLRDIDKSIPEGRTYLRGYAWVTVCPQELLQRLGGSGELQQCGAFTRVIPLRSGGALLQASETLADYTDDAMRRVFEALARILPPGDPSSDPAFPEARFVPEDASRFGHAF